MGQRSCDRVNCGIILYSSTRRVQRYHTCGSFFIGVNYMGSKVKCHRTGSSMVSLDSTRRTESNDTIHGGLKSLEVPRAQLPISNP